MKNLGELSSAEAFASNSKSTLIAVGIAVATLAALPPATHAVTTCTAAPSGLVSWWRAEGNATDSISTNNGTLSGGASFAAGEDGQAFSFDGAGEVAVPSSATLNVTTFTLEAWVNPSALDGNFEMIINKENDPAFNESDVSYELAIRGNGDPGFGSIPFGHLSFFIGGISGQPGGYGSWVDGGGAVPLNQWTHCALAFDGTSVSVYVNGALTRTIGGLSGTVIATTGAFKIGSRSALQVSGAPLSRFNGLIDETSIYNRALSGTEIQAIYNAGSAGKCPPVNCVPPPTGLVSWWRAEGNATDAVSANNGTLSAGASFATGEVGQGFSFDGTGEIVVPSTPSLNIPAAFTFEGWVNPTVVDGKVDIILNKENSPAFNESDVSYEVGIRGAGEPGGGSIPVGHLAFFLGGISGLPGSYGTWVDSNGSVPTNLWTHWALAFDGTSVSVYINGTLTRSIVGLSGTINPTTGPFKIGSRSALQLSAAPLDRFNGLIDETSLYNRALSGTEILAIYNADGGGKCSPPPPTNCIAAPSGLVSWWKGESNALDQVGGNNGALVGNATYGPGEVGKGFVFDGQGSYFSAGSSDSLRFTSNFSVAAWMFPTGAGQDPFYGGIVFNKEGEYELARFADGSIQWTVANQNPGWQWVASGGFAPLNKWTHIALAYANGLTSIFINGQLVQSYHGSGLIGDMYPNDNDLRIAGRPGYIQGFAGAIDEVAVFNRTVTPSEVAAIYAAGSSGMCPPPPSTNCVPAPSGLVSWWQSQGDAADSVGGNNGTLSGGVSFAAGEAGQAFRFDGTGEVAAPSSASLNVNSATFEAWVNPSLLDGTMEIILNKENSPAFSEPDVSYEIAIRGTGEPGAGSIPVGHLAFFLGGISGLPGAYGSWVDGGGAVPLNQWSHCALAFDGTTVRVYINGNLTRTIAGLSGTITPTTGPFKIGSRSALQVSIDPLSRFNGMIDEVSIYNRALAGSEIRAIFNADGTGKCPLPVSILAQPQDQLAQLNGTATLSVLAAGTATLGYQWRHGLTDLPSGTNRTLTLPNVQLSDAGTYSVRVSNPLNSLTSSIAVLTVNRPPIARCTNVVMSVTTNCLVNASVNSGSSDPDGDPMVISQTPPGPYGPGTNRVLLTVLDNRGGSNSCAALVVVLDGTPPSITCPPDITVTNAHSSLTSIVNFNPVTSDNCPGVSQAVCNPSSGSAFGVGTHSVLCSVLDTSGNGNQCGFNVIVKPGNVAPVPVIEISPLAHFAGYTNLIVIAPDNTNALVTFDGSKSYDSDDAHFLYFWNEGASLFGTNALASRVLAVGTHQVTLRLDDTFPLGTSSASVTVEVVSPGDAVAILIEMVDNSKLPRLTKSPLDAHLRNAAAAFDRGSPNSAVNILGAFENLVDARVAPFDSILADQLRSAAEAIINALNPPYGPKSASLPRSKPAVDDQ